MTDTPFKKLLKANDDYHEAFDEIMQLEDGEISSAQKAKLGHRVNGVFNGMDEIQNLLKEWDLIK